MYKVKKFSQTKFYTVLPQSTLNSLFPSDVLHLFALQFVMNKSEILLSCSVGGDSMQKFKHQAINQKHKLSNNFRL